MGGQAVGVIQEQRYQIDQSKFRQGAEGMTVKRVEWLIGFSVFLTVILMFFEIDIESKTPGHDALSTLDTVEFAIAGLMLFDLFRRAFRSHLRQHSPVVDQKHPTFITESALKENGIHLPVGLGSHLRSLGFLVDVVSVAPFLLSLWAPIEWLGVLRAMRILRLTKMFHYSPSTHLMVADLKRRSHQIRVVGTMASVVALLGAVSIYELEHAAQPEAFGTISNSLWWMVVTMTTVGYGDISPQTPLGKLFAMLLMPISLGIMGAVIGIVGGAFQGVNADTPEGSEEA
jgi:voltage-gated potassium channel Kch